MPPVLLTDEWIESVNAQLPALPNALYRKFREVYGLPRYDAALLTESKEMALFFDALCSKTRHYKAASNWMMGPMKSHANETGTSFADFPLKVEVIAQLIELVEEGQVSFSVAAQKIYPELILNPIVTPLEIAQRLNLIQESDSSYLIPLAEEVLLENPDKVKEFKSGKKGLLGLFMGELMKKSGGKADPKVASRIFSELLAN